MGRRHLRGLLWAAVAGVGAELCAVGLIATAAWLIARAGQHPPLSALALAIVGVRAFALFRGGLRYAERLVGHDAALRVLADLRVRVYEAVRATPRMSRDADLLQRMVADVEAVQDLLLRCALPAVVAWATGLAAVALAGALLPAAGAVLAAGVVAAGAVLPTLAALASRATARAAADARADLAVHGLDVARGATDLAAFGATDRFVARAEADAARLARLERRSGAIEAVVAALGVGVQGLTALAVLQAAHRADGVTAAVLTLTALVTVETVLPVADAARRLTEILPAARRVAGLLRAPRPRGAPPRPPQRPRRPGIELVRVRVSYGSTVALDGVDLRIPAGSSTAIVGASGAGKSTLLGVLCGEIEPRRSKGANTVLLSGAPLHAYEPRDVRATIRGLTQDAHVFDASIRANVALARPDAADDELTDAARRAGLLGWIESLPSGWDTTVSEERGLSGGQRQRLLIARALLADPAVLLLDEPAEGLDVATADSLVADLLGRSGTVVLVTHRLAPLAGADQIVVLDRGRIAQRGRHDELVTCAGPYRDLWAAERLQSGLTHPV